MPILTSPRQFNAWYAQQRRKSRLNPIAQAITKVFINLEPTASAHYSLASPWVATGDFETEVEFSSTSTGMMIFSGGTGAGGFELYLNNSGYLELFLAGAGNSTANVLVNDGKLNKAKLTRTASSVAVVVNGVGIATVAIAGTVSIYSIGRRDGGAFYFDGIISNVKLTDITTPANSLSFGLDELTADIEYPDENVFGSDVTDVTVGGTWTNNGGGSYTETVNSGSFLTLAPNQSGLFMATLTASQSGTLRVGGTDYTIASGSNNITIDPVSEDIKVLGGTGLTISNISIREVTNVLTYNNIDTLSDVRDTYTLVDGDWLGSEVWGVGDSVSTGAEGAFQTIANAGDVLTIGAFYSLNYTVSGMTTGEMGFRLGSASGDTLTVDGSFTENITANGAQLRTRVLGAQPNAGATVESIEVKRLIQVAP